LAGQPAKLERSLQPNLKPAAATPQCQSSCQIAATPLVGQQIQRLAPPAADAVHDAVKGHLVPIDLRLHLSAFVANGSLLSTKMISTGAICVHRSTSEYFLKH
jgi:hypothetical protein